LEVAKASRGAKSLLSAAARAVIYACLAVRRRIELPTDDVGRLDFIEFAVCRDGRNS